MTDSPSQNDPLQSSAHASGRESHSGARLSVVIIPAVLVIALFAVLGYSLFKSAGQNSQAIGKPAPRIDLYPLTNDDSSMRLEDVTRGKVTLLHFWGTWCPPCKVEYPELAAMVSSLGSSEFEFISVSCEAESGETLESLRRKTQAYYRSQQIGGAVYADPQGITRRSAVERLGQQTLYYPTSLVISGDGKIAGVWEGYHESGVGEMHDMIVDLLN